MWIIKIIGLAFIVLSGFLLGRKNSLQLKNRADALEWFYFSVLCIGQKISGTAAEIYDILNTILGKENYLTLKKPFCVQIKNGHLNKDDQKIIEEFFAELGMGNIESQIKRCETYADILKQRWASADNEYIKKSKLYKMLGLFSGLSIAVLLV